MEDVVGRAEQRVAPRKAPRRHVSTVARNSRVPSESLTTTPHHHPIRHSHIPASLTHSSDQFLSVSPTLDLPRRLTLVIAAARSRSPTRPIETTYCIARIPCTLSCVSLALPIIVPNLAITHSLTWPESLGTTSSSSSSQVRPSTSHSGNTAQLRPGPRTDTIRSSVLPPTRPLCHTDLLAHLF